MSRINMLNSTVSYLSMAAATEGTGTATKVTIASKETDLAKKMADIALGDDDFMSFVERDITTMEDARMSVLNWSDMMEAEYGLEQVAEMPEPDSAPKDEAEYASANMMYDKYPTGEKGRAAWGSFYADLADFLRPDIADKVEATSKRTGMYAEGAIAPSVFQAEKRKWHDRRKYLITQLKDAYTFISKRERITSEFVKDDTPTVNVIVYKETNPKTQKEEHARTKTPIFLEGRTEPGKPIAQEQLTISQFLDLDVDVAVANGGTLAALMATIKRGTGAGNKAKTQALTLSAFFDVLEEVVVFLSDDVKLKGVYRTISNKPKRSEEGVREWKDKMWNLGRLGELYNQHIEPKIGDIYAELDAETEAKDKADTAVDTARVAAKAAAGK